MVLIPAGSFEMGDHFDGMEEALPVQSVELDGFYMDVTMVAISLFMSLSPMVPVVEVGLDLTRSPSWPVVLPIATPCGR